MATWRMVQNAILAIVQGALPVQTPPIPAAIGWPSRQAIQAVITANANIVSPSKPAATKAPSAIVSVYDRMEARDTTRWNRIAVAETITQPGVQVFPLATSLKAGATWTTTLYFPPIANDAVGIMANNGRLFGGVTAVLLSSSPTLAALAEQLAANINDDPILSVMLEATVNGAAITLANLTNGPVSISLGSGNCAMRATEVHRTERRIQVTVWAVSESALEVASDPIEVAFGNLQSLFGVQLADTTWLRVRMSGDLARLDNIKEDGWRRDFFVSGEYGVTIQDTLYSVLVAFVQSQVSPAGLPPPNGGLLVDHSGELLQVDTNGDSLSI